MKRAGCSEENAETLATVLSMADYRGSFAYGLNKLEKYYNEVKAKTCDGLAEPVIEKESCTTVYINGKNALGPVIANFAMCQAVNKATDIGIGVSSAYNCHHLIFGSKYVEDAVQKGFIAFAFCNNVRTLIPFRTSQVALGTNPITVGSPGECDDSFLFNMSCTNVPMGKIELQKKINGEIPHEWAMTPLGKPETNINNIIAQPNLVPLGGDYTSQGYKGYGLALAVEMITGVLAGGAYGEAHRPYGNCTDKPNLSMTFIAVNPDMFADSFEARMQKTMNFLRKMSPTKDPVLVPGDPERLHMQKVDREGGIPYHPVLIDSINQLAHQAGVDQIKIE
ncbi:unnamed protein product [Brassicogethes aeneus]|uniref:Malate dehydrogenase n=1 Tax=Brassicogethes aeneus TaxID=1431903 RepID=A0A9P0AYX5_BRAAE|nr:unnamed protein product [Brassicogethes aeneus]